MTKKEIEKGAGLFLAAVSGCEQMVERSPPSILL